MRWTIGDMTVTSIVEQPLEDLNVLISEASPEALGEIEWLAPNYIDENGNLLGLVQCFVLETGGKTIVIDCCVGEGKDLPVSKHWHKSKSAFLSRFEEAGFDRSKVDLVLCTHMHLDHVGWNTYWDGEAWKPTFPNARYLFAQNEYDFWVAATKDLPDAAEVTDPMELFRITQGNVHTESVAPVIDAGLADFVDPPCEVAPGVRLVPSPGHTPGHACVMLESNGKKALITGDSFHHPCQIAHPEWGTLADFDAAQGAETRSDILGQASQNGMLVIGTHFSRPTVGKVVASDGSYRFESPTKGCC